MTVSNELLDRLLADYKKPEDLIGENGFLKQLTERLGERALEAALAAGARCADIAAPGETALGTVAMGDAVIAALDRQAG